MYPAFVNPLPESNMDEASQFDVKQHDATEVRDCISISY